MKTMKNLTLCIMTVGMLLLQLVSPAPARAEGEIPPPSTDVPVVATVPPTLPSPTDAASPARQDTSDPSREPPVETSTALRDEEAPSQTSVLEAAQTVADNTSMVVLDEHGQPLPLGSKEAAEVITASDPVWCPAGQAPTPGANGCTTSYATLADLVANEGGTIAADGTIWMTSGLVPEASQVTINGSTYTTWSNYALTLQGGWSGASGDATIGSNAVFSVPMNIVNWNNSIAINNLTIENVVVSGTEWLKVQTSSGDITISNSNIRNNSNTSLITRGVEFDAPGTVTISNSSYDNNEGPIGIFSANLTINNSNFTNTTKAESGIVVGPTSDCSGNTAGNVFISHSSFSQTSVGLSVGYNCLPIDTNITIDDSSFNDNGTGANLFGGNITINNSTFTNNSVAGVALTGATTTVNNSTFSGNTAGIVPGDDVTLNDVILANNEVGIESPCTPDLQLTFNHVSFLGNDVNIGSKILDCAGTPFTVINNDSTFITISSQSEGEFALDCASVDGYAVNLSSGDLVQIFCPVSGSARISSLDTTALPAPLPPDYSYASAFSLDILQNETPIPVITEGGSLKVSFAAASLPAGQAGDTYSILYWDNGTWISLKELTLDKNGSFQLNPDASDDPREILSGVKLVTNNGSPRVEVATNFPGIFVFAQH